MSVFLFLLSGLSVAFAVVTQTAYIKASTPVVGAQFGNFVSVSADGKVAAVCAWNDNVVGAQGGALYIYKQNSTGSWIESEIIVPPPYAGTISGYDFCNSVCISGDASTIAVGAVGDGASGPGLNSDGTNQTAKPGSGAVHIFELSGGSYFSTLYVKSEDAFAGDQFGHAVSLSFDGSTLAVGATHEGGKGAVHVYLRNNTGGWRFDQVLFGSNTQLGDAFGKPVALSFDGLTLATAAEGDDSSGAGVNASQTPRTSADSGAVFVFHRDLQNAPGAQWFEAVYIKSSNAQTNDAFGYGLSLSGDGLSLAVGAPMEKCISTGIDSSKVNFGTINDGAVYLFTRPSTTSVRWTEDHYFKARYRDVSAAIGPECGRSVTLSRDGSGLLVGCGLEGADVQGIDKVPNTFTSVGGGGAAYLFSNPYGTSGWSYAAYIKGSNTVNANHRFAYLSSLSADATVAFAGAFLEDNSASGINGNEAAGTLSSSGAAYAFSTGLTLLIPSSIAAGATVSVRGPYTIQPGEVVAVAGTLNVQGSLVIAGQLVVSAGGRVTSSSLAISGNLTVASGSQVAVSGPVTIASGSSLVVVVSSSGTITVASYTNAPVGSFSNVTAVPSSSVLACQSPINPPDNINYGSTALTVTVSFRDTCGGTGLSAGAIAGIVIGSVLGGLLLALGIVALAIYFSNKRDAVMRAALRQQQIAEMKPNDPLAL